jgi:hypothetical protein
MPKVTAFALIAAFLRAEETCHKQVRDGRLPHCAGKSVAWRISEEINAVAATLWVAAIRWLGRSARIWSRFAI